MEDEWDYNNKLTALAQREQAVRTDLSNAIYRYCNVEAAAVAARAEVAAQEEKVQAEVENIRRERLIIEHRQQQTLQSPHDNEEFSGSRRQSLVSAPTYIGTSIHSGGAKFVPNIFRAMQRNAGSSVSTWTRMSDTPVTSVEDPLRDPQSQMHVPGFRTNPSDTLITPPEYAASGSSASDIEARQRPTLSSARTNGTPGSSHRDPVPNVEPWQHPAPDTQAARSQDSALEDRAPEDPAPEVELWRYLPTSSTVVRVLEGWIEVDCPICHGNYVPRSRRYAKGLSGIFNHIRQCHHPGGKLKMPNAATMAQEYKVRDVPGSEVLKLVQGDNTIIEKRNPCTADEGASYQQTDDHKLHISQIEDSQIEDSQIEDSQIEDRRSKTPHIEDPQMEDSPESSPDSDYKPNIDIDIELSPCRQSLRSLGSFTPALSKPEERGYKIGQQVRKATSIVLVPGGWWAELRCYICHGNAFKSTEALAKGVSGFKTHLRIDHEVVGLSDEDVIKKCTIRELLESEVKVIEAFDEWNRKDDPIEHVLFRAGPAKDFEGQGPRAADHDADSDTNDDTSTEMK